MWLHVQREIMKVDFVAALRMRTVLVFEGACAPVAGSVQLRQTNAPMTMRYGAEEFKQWALLDSNQ